MDQLKDYYYGLVDKSWSFAETLEEKGIPISTFCDKYNINPLLLIIVLILAIIILIALAMGSFSSVAYGELTVTVTSSGSPVEGATISYDFGDETPIETTTSTGKATIKFPIGQEVTLMASKSGYATSSVAYTMTEKEDSLSMTIDRKVGSLRVSVGTVTGVDVPSSVVVHVEAPNGDYENTGRLDSSDEVLFENIPSGVEARTWLSLGAQTIPGDTKTIVEGETVEVSIDIPKNAMEVSLDIVVSDTSYNYIQGATVALYDWDTEARIATSQTTDSSGTVTFDGLSSGDKVYATIDPKNTKYSMYNGKTKYQPIELSTSDKIYRIELETIGAVEVCVYDNNNAPLLKGTITIRDSSGTSYATQDITSECMDFYGFPEGIAVYPSVTATGFASYSDSSKSQVVSYSTKLQFTVVMSPLTIQTSNSVYVHVSDCDGKSLKGIKVMIIDAQNPPDVLAEGRTECMGTAVISLPEPCGNLACELEGGRQIYAIAYDEDYVMNQSRVTTVSAGEVLDITICEANDDNSGDIEVCVYKDASPARHADIELYDYYDDKLIWIAEAGDNEYDEENCNTFKNLPDGTVVYARGINIGSKPATSNETVEIVAGTVGHLNLFAGEIPFISKTGDIKVCAKNEDGLALKANVTIYDYMTDQIIIAGQTIGAGCVLFEDIDAQSNDGGIITARQVYALVEKHNYATYNGLDEGDVLDMIPEGQLQIDVTMPDAYEICVQTFASDTSEPMDVKVVLYYNESGTPIAQVRSGDNGTAKFYQSLLDTYYFKVIEDYSLYEAEDVYTFDKEDVTGGQCGKIELVDLGTLCALSMEVLDSGKEIRTISGNVAKVPIRIFDGSERGDNSISNEGSYLSTHNIGMLDGKLANMTLMLNSDYNAFSLGYEATTYSPDFELVLSINTDDTGTYNGVIDFTKNPLCSAQAEFSLEVYEENLYVSVDSVTFDPITEKSASFCIYVEDQDGDSVTDASVSFSIDEMDGWTTTGTRAATYNEIKDCYRATLTSTMASDMESGTYPLYVIAKRAGLTKTVEADAQIATTDLCGNGEKDSGEVCDPELESSCKTGFSCESDCSACVEDAVGPISVSADDVSISIGSGSSTGFCAYVYEENGTENTKSKVTANFYGSDGWPKDYSRSVSYDISRGCYYIGVSDSVAWPAGAVTNVDSLTGSKSIYISALDGKRTATTTSMATVECGCDKEKYPEPTCPCDDDAQTGGSGSINFFDCVNLMGSQGYYPTTPTGIPYSPYAQQRATLSQGSLGLSGAGGAGIGLNLEACKNLFGDLGLGGFLSSDADMLVIEDDCGVIDAATCTKLKDGITNKDAFAVYSKGKYTCCSMSSCDKDSIEKLRDSASTNGKLEQIRIDSIDDLTRTYISSSKYRLYPGDNGNAIYHSGVALLSKGAVVSATSSKTYDRVVGLTDCSDEVIKKCVREQITDIIGDSEGVYYPKCSALTPEYKSIVFSDSGSGIPSDWGVRLKPEKSYPSEMLNRVGEDTTVRIVASYEDENGAAWDLAKDIYNDEFPKFTKEYVSYCTADGNSGKTTEKKPVLMLSNKVFVSTDGDNTGVCKQKKAADDKRLTLETKPDYEYPNTGFAYRKGPVYVYMSGSNEYVSELLRQTWEKSLSSGEKYILGVTQGSGQVEDMGLMLRCKKKAEDKGAIVCGFQDNTKLDSYHAEISGICSTYCTGKELYDCLCVSDAPEYTASIAGTVTYGGTISDLDLTKTQYGVEVFVEKSKDGTYVKTDSYDLKIKNSEDIDAAKTSCSEKTCNFKIDNLDPDYTLYVWANLYVKDMTNRRMIIKCLGTKDGWFEITKEDLVPNTVFEPVDLVIADDEKCETENSNKYKFKITGNVVDACGNPVPKALVKVYLTGQKDTEATLLDDFTLEPKTGDFSGTIEATSATTAYIYAVVDSIQGNKALEKRGTKYLVAERYLTAPLSKERSTKSRKRGTTSTSTSEIVVSDKVKLKFTDLMYAAVGGTLSNCKAEGLPNLKVDLFKSDGSAASINLFSAMFPTQLSQNIGDIIRLRHRTTTKTQYLEAGQYGLATYFEKGKNYQIRVGNQQPVFSEASSGVCKGQMAVLTPYMDANDIKQCFLCINGQRLNDYNDPAGSADASNSYIEKAFEPANIYQGTSTPSEGTFTCSPASPKVGTSKLTQTSTGTADYSKSSDPCVKEYGEYIDAAAKETMLDRNLILAVIKQESSCNSKAINGASYGIMQVETGFTNKKSNPGKVIGWCGETFGTRSLSADLTTCRNQLLNDVELNIYAGAHILKEYRQSCKGGITCSGAIYTSNECELMKYNCGITSPCTPTCHIYANVVLTEQKTLDKLDQNKLWPTTAPSQLPIPVCGDGTCNGAETCVTCPNDCKEGCETILSKDLSKLVLALESKSLSTTVTLEKGKRSYYHDSLTNTIINYVNSRNPGVFDQSFLKTQINSLLGNGAGYVQLLSCDNDATNILGRYDDSSVTLTNTKGVPVVSNQNVALDEPQKVICNEDEWGSFTISLVADMDDNCNAQETAATFSLSIQL